jgi:molybdenum cofactor synthesis domain-containing protein
VAGGVYADRCGEILDAEVVGAGHRVARREVVPDGAERLTALLCDLADAGEIDLIVTSGGTGISPSDRTPEATVAACERLTPGIAEAIRATSLATTLHAMLSRGAAGVRGRTLIVNLPGSPGGARDGWATIAPIVEHAASQLGGGDHPRSE